MTNPHKSKPTPTVAETVNETLHTFIDALETIVALRGYKGEDMGRVAGYSVAADIAEEALRKARG